MGWLQGILGRRRGIVLSSRRILINLTASKAPSPNSKRLAWARRSSRGFPPAPISRSPPRRSRRPWARMKALAAQVGIPADKVADMLTKYLPVAIDKATTAGNLPQQQSAYSWLQSNW